MARGRRGSESANRLPRVDIGVGAPAAEISCLPVKMGGIAAQQADVVAACIAKRAGAPVAPQPLAPTISGLLVGGGTPLALSATLVGGTGRHSRAALASGLPRAEKVAARYLTPYLEAHHPQAAHR